MRLKKRYDADVPEVALRLDCTGERNGDLWRGGSGEVGVG